MKHIAIVGAGICGRLLALNAIQQGYAVSIFDQLPLHQKRMLVCRRRYVITGSRIECSCIQLYTIGFTLIKPMATTTSRAKQPVYFSQQGSLMLAHRQDQQELQHFSQLLQHKLGTAAAIQWLNPDQLAQLEPGLAAHHQNVLLFGNEANIATEQVLTSLAQTLLAAGVNWYPEHHVTQLAPYRVTANQQSFDFDCVADCRGLGAQDHWPELRAVRGELIWLHAPEVQLQRPIRLLHPRYRLYVVPRANQHYLIGASEIDSFDDSPISVRSCLELLSAAYSLHQSFAEARIIKTVTQCRAAFADNEPQLEYQPGLIRINGLYRHGYLLAPALCEQAMQQINQTQPEVVNPC